MRTLRSSIPNESRRAVAQRERGTLMTELRRMPWTRMLRARLALTRAIGALSGVIVAGALAQSEGKTSSYIGKLEGPEVVTDAAKAPKTFKEAPQLAELVKAGKLPPVAERVGQDPVVIKPLKEVAKYGGTWRAALTEPGDFWNGLRSCSGPDHRHFWDYTAHEVLPNRAKVLTLDG